LRQRVDSVQLVIRDNGIGFDPEVPPVKRNGNAGFGILGMRKRATYVGGVLHVKSRHSAGTEIEARIPLAVAASAS
jgi:signal transduction histidine kinase